MTFEEGYQKLSQNEQERFQNVVQELLGHTYLVAQNYDFDKEMRRTDQSYLFAERNLDLLQTYFRYAGFYLEASPMYGVICLRSEADRNRFRFDALTTKMIFTLRLMYDEKRRELSLTADVFTTMEEVLQKMLMIGALDKKPAQASISDSMRKISSFRLVKKEAGSWNALDTRMIILPSILFAVTAEQIMTIQKLSEEDENEDTEETAADTLV